MFSLLPPRFLFTSLVLIVLAHNGFAAPPASPAPEWNAKFAGREGWIGGDAVYSVKVNADRVLWFFGDTFIGTVKDGRRHAEVMVNNTVGVLKGMDAGSEMAFFHGRKKDGRPDSILTPNGQTGYYWPLGAAMSGKKLIVFLTRVVSTKEGGPFGFRGVEQVVCAIANPTDEPTKWNATYAPLPHALLEKDHERSWGNAVLTVGETTYVYGVWDRDKKMGTRKLLVAKVPTATLADPATWRFRTAAGWSERADDAVAQATGLATEFSVGPAPVGGFVAVYTEFGLSDRIVARFAADPLGPWSDSVLLYSCPEKTDKRVFCYAAKAHAWFGSDELLVSYCTNAKEFATAILDQSIYRPKFVRVKWAERP